MIKTNVIIIGAGIGGITTAIYLKRANIDFILLECDKIGGKLNIIKNVDNYPGFSSISGEELILNLKEQLEHLSINITKECAINLAINKEGYLLTTNNNSYISKCVVIATGLSKKNVSICNEEEFIGKGVSYCATCDGAFFKNKVVCVYGNNNIALEESLYLSNIANKVLLITKENTLQGDEELINAVNAKSNIDVKNLLSIKEIKGEDFMQSIILSNNEIINIDGLFPLYEARSASQLLNNLYVETNKNFLVVDNENKTIHEGLYAIGDISDTPLRQLITASRDGAIASSSIIKFLNK